MKFSSNLKKIRKEKNMSQEQLAEKLGVSRQSVSKWESGAAYPEMEKILQLCKLFDLNINELLNDNVKEVNDKKEIKDNLNKYIDNFLDFITKTVNMFTSFTFKDKVKCLLEQFIIINLLLIMILIIGNVSTPMLYGILNLFPNFVADFIYHLFTGIYSIVGFIVLVVIVLHVFKVRYLNYYTEEERNEDTLEEEKEEEIKEEKVKEEKKSTKEKIIIRDEKDSSSNFLELFLKITINLFKVLAVFIIIPAIFTLVGLSSALFMTFLFMKTGLVFVGAIIIIIAMLIMNIIVINLLYSFIVNRKTNKVINAFIFITAAIIMGFGVGLSFVGFTEFEYENTTDSKYFIETEENIKFRDNMYISNSFGQINFIEEEFDDLKITYRHPKHMEIELKRNSPSNYYFTADVTNEYNLFKNVISMINERIIINVDNFDITIRTNKENIEILKENMDYNDVRVD